MIFGNKEIRTRIARKKNVPPGLVGELVDYIVPANKYFSENSQDEADAMAKSELSTLGQEFADKHGSFYSKIFYNDRLEKKIQRNNCPDGPSGYVVYVVPEGKYVSYDSKEDANAKALEDANTKGQEYANLNGVCCQVYYSIKLEDIFYKQDCPEGFGDRSGVKYTMPSGFVKSLNSQVEADEDAYEKFLKLGQEYANKSSSCEKLYFNEKKTGFFSRKCPSGMSAKEVHVTVNAGEVSSFISVKDANDKASELLKKRGERKAREKKCNSI